MSDQNTSVPAPASAPEAPQSSSNTPQSPDQQALQNAVANGTPQQQAVAKKMLKEIKYKANGIEHTETLGFEIPEDQVEWMQKQLSMNKGAQKSMSEKAQLENEIKSFFGDLKGNTKDTLAKLGIDPKQFAAMMLEEELKQQAMSPEQKELEELKAKYAQSEKDKKAREEEFTQKELERATKLEYERISTRMEKAIETSGLPKDPAIVQRMAKYMLLGNQYNVQLDPEDVVGLVRDEMFAEISSLVKQLGADKVEQLVGKDILKQIRQKNLAKSKQTPGTAKAAIKDVGVVSKKEAKETPKKTFKDHFGF